MARTLSLPYWARNRTQTVYLDQGPRAAYRPSVRRAHSSAPFKRNVKRRKAPLKRTPPTQTMTRRNVKRAVKRAYKGWYQTKGYSAPRFLRPKKWSGNPTLKRGCLLHVEQGGVTGDSDSVYIGHAFAIHQLFRSMCHALIKRLFYKAGYTFVSWDDKIQQTWATEAISPGTIKYHYRTDDHSLPQVQIVVTLQADKTYATAADDLFNSIVDTCVAAGAVETFFVTDMKLDITGVPTNNADAIMNVANCNFHFNCTSRMALQNRTLAKTGAGDESSMLDVANNPLEGKSYEGRGNGTGYAQHFSSLGTNGTSTFVSGDMTGVIDFWTGGAGVGTEVKAQLKRPPSASVFSSCNRSSKAMLNPGAIRNSVLRWTRVYNCRTIFAKLQSYLLKGRAANRDAYVDLGSWRVFGFQKKCATGQDEPNISIGYELNAHYGCYMTEKPVIGSVRHQVLASLTTGS